MSVHHLELEKKITIIIMFRESNNTGVPLENGTLIGGLTCLRLRVTAPLNNNSSKLVCVYTTFSYRKCNQKTLYYLYLYA